MERRLAVLFFVGLVCVVSVHSQLELRVPRISTFLNRITNTTFGFIRGGVNIFGRTIERVINTFSRVEDRLRAVIEEIRKQIIKGIPELSIPVLDPLHVDKVEFDISKQSIRLKGKAENVTIKHISKFTVDKATFTDMGNWNFQLDLDVTFPYLIGNGLYELDGVIGDVFRIFGDGPFWINLFDLKIRSKTLLRFEGTRIRVTDLDIGIKLRKLQNNFENLMNDKENGELINKAISRLAPEAIDMFWPELKTPVETQVMKYINNVLENATVASLARRLFNIR